MILMKKRKPYLPPEIIVQEIVVEAGIALSTYSDPGKPGNLEHDPESDHINF